MTLKRALNNFVLRARECKNHEVGRESPELAVIQHFNFQYRNLEKLEYQNAVKTNAELRGAAYPHKKDGTKQ